MRDKKQQDMEYVLKGDKRQKDMVGYTHEGQKVEGH